MSPKLAIPETITSLPLPPRSPDLNSVETVWQFMHENWLSNRIFKSHDDIVALCSETSNKLISDPNRITSIGWRNRANGFLIVRLGISLDPRAEAHLIESQGMPFGGRV